jgi:ABC-2 type transport system ATP-binding protein
LAGCSIEKINDKSLNVAVPKQVGLNQLFSQLTQQHIQVISMKNKSNRLEQLFLDLIDAKAAGAKQ